MKEQSKKKSVETQEPQQSPQGQPTSVIDLRSLPVRRLLELKEEIDEILVETDVARMGPSDLLLEYDVCIRDVNGVKCRNSGASRLNGILHPRMLAAAPGRLESEFESQVFSPLNAGLYDMVDSSDASPGRSIGGMGGMLPAYTDNRPLFDPAPQVIEASATNGRIS